VFAELVLEGLENDIVRPALTRRHDRKGVPVFDVHGRANGSGVLHDERGR